MSRSGKLLFKPHAPENLHWFEVVSGDIGASMRNQCGTIWARSERHLLGQLNTRFSQLSRRWILKSDVRIDLLEEYV